MPVDKWTEEQVLSAIKLYCKIPFGKLHSKNPQIIQLANEIGRTANALALKMVNIASLDPTIDRKGMSNVSKVDRDVWEKFFSNIDRYLEEDNEEKGGFSENAQATFAYDDERVGLNVSGMAVQRRGQAYFREMVLASYDGKCAISGMSEPQLLSASHIAPWATETIRRLDPRNGICLNAIYDRAFDRGLIAISDEFRVLYSNAMTRETAGQLQSMASKNTIKASRFQPDIALLRAHRVRFGDQFSAL